MAKQSSMKYHNLISQTDQERSEAEVELQVQQSKSAWEVDIATTKRDLSNAKAELTRMQRAVPYSVHNEIASTQRVSALESGLEIATAILKERF